MGNIIKSIKKSREKRRFQQEVAVYNRRLSEQRRSPGPYNPDLHSPRRSISSARQSSGRQPSTQPPTPSARQSSRPMSDELVQSFGYKRKHRRSRSRRRPGRPRRR